jgi:plastocyanin
MSRFRFVLAVMVSGFAAGCGGGYSGTPSSPTPNNPAPNTPNTVAIPTGAQTRGSSAYAPNPITVAAGTTVTWSNNDSTAHTVTSNGGAFDSGAIGAGGTYPYHCGLHPGMVGSVVVQ